MKRTPWTSYTYYAPTPARPTFGVLVKATYPGPTITNYSPRPTRASQLRRAIHNLEDQGQAVYAPAPYGFSAIVNPNRKETNQ